MGVSTKGRRKITVDGKLYVWYVAKDDDSWYDILNIISENKEYVLAVPLNIKKWYIISKGRTFQGRITSGCWERYLLPMEIPEAVVPGIVADIIRWSVSGNDAEKVDWHQVDFPV